MPKSELGPNEATELVWPVDLTDHEIQALLDVCEEAREIVKGFSPDVRAKYESQPMWSACSKLEKVLYG